MDEKKAPLATYLREIRKRLILSFIAVGVGFVICYGFSDSIFDILAAPLIKTMPAENTLIFRTVPIKRIHLFLRGLFSSGFYPPPSYTSGYRPHPWRGD